MDIKSFFNHQVLVIDDLLAPKEFARLSGYATGRSYLGRRNFSGYRMSYALQNVIHLTPGGMQHAPALAEEAAARRVIATMPTGEPPDLVTDRFEELSELIAPTVGRTDCDWYGYTRTMFRSKAGAGLPWHSDAGIYSGAYIFYASPTWDADWGGELCAQSGICTDLHGRSRDDKVALLNGGTYFYPRPNRLVFIKGGTPHKVSAVDASAGVHRHTITGFFLSERGVELKEKELVNVYQSAPLWRRIAIHAALRLLKA